MRKFSHHAGPIIGRFGELWVRLVSLGYLVGMAAGPIAVLVGVGGWRLYVIAGALFALAIAGLCHNWLRRHHEIDPGPHVLDEMTGGRAIDPADRVQPLVPLLQAWDVLERRRGTAAFDPPFPLVVGVGRLS